MLRRLSANYIYTVTGNPLKNGIIELDDSGKIVKIIDTNGDLRESRNLEFYNGIITPGFINAHCHLELSELQNQLSEKLGLPDFLERIFLHKKKQKSDLSYKSIKLQDSLMQKNGIVAVGDICNTIDSLEVKRSSKIYYHNFVEAIGINTVADEIFDKNKKILKEYLQKGLMGSIVPHAPYSVSNKLFKLISDFAVESNSILSIHNQETEAENQMFIDKSGALIEKLTSLGIDYKDWSKTGENSVQSIFKFLPRENNILFVHNTYSKKKDLELTKSNLSNAYWCLCPLSNLFIEDRLPDIELFLNYSDSVVLGTDSLASNKLLSILEEMKVLQKECNEIKFEELIQWATINGAKALKIENSYGSLELGKTPGINLISNFDFQEMKLTDKSEVKVLV